MEHINLQFKSVEIDEQGIFTGYAAIFGNVDLTNDIIEPGAFAKTIASGAAKDGVPIFAQHQDWTEPIGKTLELREDKKGLWVKGYISDTVRGKDYRKLVKDGILTQMSIGYDPTQYTVDTKSIRHLLELELFEISIVNYPANSEARINDYKGGSHMDPKEKDTKNTVKETKADEQVILTKDELKEIVTQAAQAGAAEALKAVTPEEEIPEEEKPEDEDEEKTEGKKAAPKAKEQKAAPQNMQRKYADIYISTGAQPKEEKSGLPPGIGFVRYQKCMMRAERDFDKAANIAKKSYEDPFLERQIKAMSVTAPSDGGYLVPEVYANELIPMIYAKSIVSKLGALDLDMANGNMTIPKQIGSSSAGYVGELRKTKASKPKMGKLKMSSKKLMGKIIIGNDLIKSSSIGADRLILKDATTVMALRRDKAALFGSGSEYEPLGIFKMKDVPTIDINSLPDEKTIGAMLGALIQKDVDTTKLGWGFNGFAWQALYNVTGGTSGLYIYRDDMKAGKLGGHEFAISNQIPAATTTGNPTDIILGDWSEYMIARQGQMESEFFREGTVTDEDGSLISAVDDDFTILRLIDLHDFGVRHEESFVIGKGLKTTA
jgi:HK97 family phage major capsid protein/HK97 family phage prohead protease